MRLLLVRFVERLFYDLGLKGTNSRIFALEDELFHPVQALARQEGRSPGEVAAGLVAEALEHRRAAEARLSIWQALTRREQEVTALACLNYTNAEIAQILFLSEETVKTHLQRIVPKFGLRRKDQLQRALAEWDFRAWDQRQAGEEE